MKNDGFALHTEQVYKDGKLKVKSFPDSHFPTATGFQFLLTVKELMVKSSWHMKATFLSLIEKKKKSKSKSST